jgi:hypothetical protein
MITTCKDDCLCFAKENVILILFVNRNEDSTNNDEIYPVPESFRVFDEHTSENDASDNDTKETLTNRKSKKDEQVNYLDELDKDLQKELKHTFTPRGTLAGKLTLNRRTFDFNMHFLINKMLMSQAIARRLCLLRLEAFQPERVGIPKQKILTKA